MKKKELEELYDRFLNQHISEDMLDYKSDDPDKNHTGCRALSYNYYLLSSLEWYLYKSSFKFFDYMKKSVDFKKMDYELCKKNNPNFKTYYPMSEVLMSLSSGDKKLINIFSVFLDDNHDYDEKPSSHPAPWLYRCLIVLVLDRYNDQFPTFMEKLKKGYSTKKWGKLMPYAELIDAIWTRDEVAFHTTLETLANTHKSMLRGLFSDEIEQKLLCLWGIGLCQLARIKGMNIDFDHEYIPRELISAPK
jgi:hypothetical protein